MIVMMILLMFMMIVMVIVMIMMMIVMMIDIEYTLFNSNFNVPEDNLVSSIWQGHRNSVSQ